MISLKDVAKKHGIEYNALVKFAKESPDDYVIDEVDSLMSLNLKYLMPESNEARFIAGYQDDLRRLEKEAQDREDRAQAKKRACAKMLITSGFNFDGYRISKYSGYISGDGCVQVERGQSIWAADVGEMLSKSLINIRREALQELKEAAYDLGCNAVIGVDFDYITLDPQTATATGGTLYQPYVFCVTANGNAVVIEKE